MSGNTLLSMDDVNSMPFEQFTAVFSNVVEHCPLCAATVWQHRPFTDVHHIHKLICDVFDHFPNDAKRGLLRLHPDIAWSVAGLTSESQTEQKAAGIESLTSDERAKLQERNKSYKEKFNFPFVVCARKNKIQAILDGLKLRLENTIEEEVRKGVQQVKEIVLLRLFGIVEH